MTTKEIADKLVQYCRDNKYEQCYSELYSPNCKSIEAEGSPWPVANGMAEIAEKGKKWQENIQEFHGGTVGDPIAADGYFACNMIYDVTFKEGGRQKMNELCVYKVEDGKITEERFFYTV
ncbi:MAG: nuclear transport factor 2 family protein [Bacteroidia bacterium]|nr:nuclear transport factor 2 family protein [Bacteroidia bacterium]